MPEELYVPERMRIAQPARVGNDVSPYGFPLLCVELSWPSAMLLSPQCGQPMSLELIYPTLDCASVHSEPIPDSIAIEPMADEQNGMQAVVVAGFCRPCDLGFQACRVVLTFVIRSFFMMSCRILHFIRGPRKSQEFMRRTYDTFYR